jgi:hypothetical protein
VQATYDACSISHDLPRVMVPSRAIPPIISQGHQASDASHRVAVAVTNGRHGADRRQIASPKSVMLARGSAARRGVPLGLRRGPVGMRDRRHRLPAGSLLLARRFSSDSSGISRRAVRARSSTPGQQGLTLASHARRRTATDSLPAPSVIPHTEPLPGTCAG